MREKTRTLIQLHKLDNSLRNLQSTKEGLTRDLDEINRTAEDGKQILENFTEESQSFRKLLDKRELDLKDIESRMARFQTQLNMTKTNKEYSALQHEVMGLEADKSRIEDEIITMLDQLDKHKEELQELTQRAQATAQAAEERQESVGAGLRDADARIERLHREREELAAQIPREFLAPYKRLRQRGNGTAMAACRNFVCQGCRMSLTANTVNRLLGGTELVYCHSCGRILYLPEDEDAQGGAGAGRKE